MPVTPEQSRSLASRPLARMQWFASLLNWRDLRLERVAFTPDEATKYNVPPPGIIAYYMTTDLKFNLQINENPVGQSVTHQATIKADRYGIANIGWHPFTLFESNDELRREAERLRPWLDRRHYRDRRWLRDLKAQHQEMLMPSRKRPRGRQSNGPP